jgi:hypothetical protein
MANGKVAMITGDGAQFEWQMGDYAQMVSWNYYRMRLLRTDWSGTVEAPVVRVEAQTDREGNRFTFWTTYEYDPTPEKDGQPWGFRWKAGEITTDASSVTPHTLRHSWELEQIVSHGETAFHRGLPRTGLSPSTRPVRYSGLTFGGRQVLPEEALTTAKRFNGTIYVTAESWRNVEWNVSCACCGDDPAPIDVTTGEPLDCDGDPMCLRCWRTCTAERDNVPPASLTPPQTVPRFVILHAGANSAPSLEVVDIDPRRPYRSADCGVYNFVTQTWTCNNLLNHDGRHDVCGTRTPVPDPSEWARCCGCSGFLILR